MSKQIKHVLSPEERELEKKRAELERLRAELADRELELATLRGDLASLEDRYRRVVGVRYAVLDEAVAMLESLLARLRPDDDSRRRVQEAQARARAFAAESATRDDVAEVPRSADVKDMFRELARTIHPDLASDDAERKKRHELMKQANLAYARGDAAALSALLAGVKGAAEAVTGEGVAHDLIRAIRQIDQVERRLAAIEEEMESLRQSDAFKLFESVRHS